MRFQSVLSLCLQLIWSLGVEFSIPLIICLTTIYLYLKLWSKSLVEWPVLGNLPCLLCNINRLNDWVVDVLKDLGCGTFICKGPVFSGMNIVFTCNPQNVEHMMKTNSTNFEKGPHFAEIFDFLGNGIFIADGESWYMQRKMAISRFVSKRFRSFCSEKNEEVVVDGLIPVLQAAVERGSPIDLQEVFKRLAFDVTFASVLGKNPGFLSVNLMENGFSKALDTLTRVAFFRHLVPSFWWKTMQFLGVGWEREYNQALQSLDRHLAEFILLKKQDLADGIISDDLLETYMRSTSADEQKFIQSTGGTVETFLRDTALTFIFAGQDTVSSGLTWFFWLLSKSPSVEAKILEELKLVTFNERSPEHFKSNPSILWSSSSEELKKLNYLEAAILESLRLHPPIPLEHKSAKKDNVLPDGTGVRPGMIISYSLYAMGRMEWIWGDHCMDFKPERWIDQRDGNIRQESDSKYPVFNVGQRACLGKRMAITTMKTVIVAILLNFHVEVVKGQSVRPESSVILKMKDGLKVTVTQRKMKFN